MRCPRLCAATLPRSVGGAELGTSHLAYGELFKETTRVVPSAQDLVLDATHFVDRLASHQKSHKDPEKIMNRPFRREPRGAQFSVPFGQGKRSASLTQPLTLSIN